jgi:hypothetical protein
MPDVTPDIVLKYPPREIDPRERELIDQWLSLTGDVSVAHVSARRSDDPALYRRIVIATGPGTQPTHLIHAPNGLRLWIKLTIGPSEVDVFDSLYAALNSIRDVLKHADLGSVGNNSSSGSDISA